MIALKKREVTTGEFPDMTHDELEIEWRMAKECFDQALAQKSEADSIYVAAATRLNTLDRMVKKGKQREAADRREDARSIDRRAKAGIHVLGK